MTTTKKKVAKKTTKKKEVKLQMGRQYSLEEIVGLEPQDLLEEINKACDNWFWYQDQYRKLRKDLRQAKEALFEIQQLPKDKLNKADELASKALEALGEK